MMRLVVSIFLLALVSCDRAVNSADAPNDHPPPRGTVTQYGIFQLLKKGRLQDSEASNTGKIIKNPVLELAEQTSRIPLRKGTYFAYQYRLWRFPPEVRKKPWVDLRRVLIHPEMTRPDGSTTTGSEHRIRKKIVAGQVIALDGYALTEDYEMVEGVWRFQIWYRNTLLLEQRFTSYRAT